MKFYKYYKNTWRIEIGNNFSHNTDTSRMVFKNWKVVQYLGGPVARVPYRPFTPSPSRCSAIAVTLLSSVFSDGDPATLSSLLGCSFYFFMLSAYSWLLPPRGFCSLVFPMHVLWLLDASSPTVDSLCYVFKLP